MNITDATRVQTLLGWLTDPHQTSDTDQAAARESAVHLATVTHQRLGAGLTGPQMTTAWPGLLTGCAGCPTCTAGGTR